MQELKQREDTVLQISFLNTKAHKPILIVTQNKIMKLFHCFAVKLQKEKHWHGGHEMMTAFPFPLIHHHGA